VPKQVAKLECNRKLEQADREREHPDEIEERERRGVGPGEHNDPEGDRHQSIEEGDHATEPARPSDSCSEQRRHP
jgi:hypothetical protein